MFSAIRQLPKTVGISSRLFCSTAKPAARRPLGYARVLLSGEIITEPMALRSGTSSFLLKTRGDDDHYTVHRVHTNFPEGIAAGRHAYVNGFLKTSEFTNETEKPRFEATVKAAGTTIIKPSHQDTNFVEAKGLVYSQSIEATAFSMFRILTSFQSNSQERSLVSQFIPIFVYDPALRELVKDALERNMIVRVVGQLDNRNELNKEGKRRSSAHIRASNIFVSERRGQIAAEVDGTSSDSSSSSDDEQTTEQQSATATGQPQAKE